MKRVLVIGGGGLAREVSDWFADSLEIVGYASRDTEENRCYSMLGKCFTDDISPDQAGTHFAVIAIGSPHLKAKLFNRFKAKGFSFPTLIHPFATLSASVRIAEGSIVCPGCVVSAHSQIGQCSYVNFMVGIGHGVILGDFCQINPGCQIGGTVTVGDGVFIGSGATILNNMSIGAGATIASGAVIYAPVAEKATMMGNPAKRMRALEKE